MSNQNLKSNWATLGYSLLFILALICWPVTLGILGVYILTKILGTWL